MRTLSVSLVLSLLIPAGRADSPADPVKTAIEKGLSRIEQGAGNYLKNRQCFSCHHQAMAILTMAAAKQRGFTVEPEKLQQQLDFTINTFKHKRVEVSQGRAVPGANTMAAYALFALEAGGHPRDETTAALVQFLLARQKADGSWPALSQRPPSEGSPFTNAALALRALRAYGPARDAEGVDELRERIDKAFGKGRDWLLKSKPGS